MREEDTEYNFSHMKKLLIEAAAASPDVIILPETWNTGFFPKENIKALSDKNAGRTKELLSFISREYKVSIIGGSVTEEKDGNIFNTCYIYNDKGENIASYSKTHLFTPMKEHDFYKAGEEVFTFTLAGVKAAVIICYDLRFPELSRKLSLEGAEILFVPSQWPKERISQLEILLRARAVENQMFTVLCNSCGEFNKTVFGGNSLVSDPYGNIVLKAGEKEEIITADIDLDIIKNIRKTIPVFDDRRPELY